MAIITLRLSAVNSYPRVCRYCGHPVLQKWARSPSLFAIRNSAQWWCNAIAVTTVSAPLRQLVQELPVTRLPELFTLYEQLPPARKRRRARASPLYRLKQLVLHLSEHWSAYRLYQERADVPRTNNRAEQAIGRWPTRSRSVRGFKSASGWQSAFWVCVNSRL